MEDNLTTIVALLFKKTFKLCYLSDYRQLLYVQAVTRFGVRIYLGTLGSTLGKTHSFPLLGKVCAFSAEYTCEGWLLWVSEILLLG